MIWPLSFIVIMLWLALFVIFQSRALRLVSGFFGIAVAFSILAFDETWIASDPITNAITLITISTIYDYIIGTVLLGFSLIGLYSTITGRELLKMKEEK